MATRPNEPSTCSLAYYSVRACRSLRQTTGSRDCSEEDSFVRVYFCARSCILRRVSCFVVPVVVRDAVCPSDLTPNKRMNVTRGNRSRLVTTDRRVAGNTRRDEAARQVSWERTPTNKRIERPGKRSGPILLPTNCLSLSIRYV